MRTTVRLDPDLMAAAKRLAVSTNRTLTAVIEDALREVIARRPLRPKASIELPVYGGSGVMPGIDINNTAALMDLMDEDDDALRR